METVESRWQMAVNMFFRPRLLLQGVVEYLLAWSFTRQWWQLILLYFPWFLLVAATLGVAAYGLKLERKTLVARYQTWVTAEIPQALRQTEEQNSDKDQSETSNKVIAQTDVPEDTSTDADSRSLEEDGNETQVSEYGELLLRRLLQLEDSSSRITYLVAAQLGRKDRTGQARQMMRRIAPEGGGGFAPAYAWLAVDQLKSRQINTLEDKKRLLKDLEMAARWSHTRSELLSVYADLLESEGDWTQAIAILDRANTQESDLAIDLKVAEMAARHGQKQQFDRAAESLKKKVRAKMESETATSTDLAYLSNLFLIEQLPEKARSVVTLAIKKDPDNPLLKRLLSESFRLQYLLSVQQQDGQAQVNLALLDAALKADPTNPAVGTEVARLVAAGQDASPELMASLEQQLGSGQASALTHILLANKKLRQGELVTAIPHLETALYQAPNSPVIMNNLSLALALTNPEALDRALQLSVAAVNGDPNNANYRDTLGEVRALKGDRLGAIESYEIAIRLDATRSDSRQKLAEIYRELGMLDMAAVQDRELQKLLEN